VLADPAAPVGAAGRRSALAAKLWLCSEEFAAKAAPTRTNADLISTYKTIIYLIFDGSGRAAFRFIRENLRNTDNVSRLKPLPQGCDLAQQITGT
jgi:hypothetical protein